METFVDKLVDLIVGGELYLAGFSTEKGAKIKVSRYPLVANWLIRGV